MTHLTENLAVLSGKYNLSVLPVAGAGTVVRYSRQGLGLGSEVISISSQYRKKRATCRAVPVRLRLQRDALQHTWRPPLLLCLIYTLYPRNIFVCLDLCTVRLRVYPPDDETDTPGSVERGPLLAPRLPGPSVAYGRRQQKPRVHRAVVARQRVR